MDSSSKTVDAMVTPGKEKSSRSNLPKTDGSKKCSENFNPNLSSPNSKPSNSPSVINSEKSARKDFTRSPNPNQMASPLLKSKIRGRKFVIAKKKSRNEESNSSTSAVVCQKCKKTTKCLCVAHQSLRASQEEFFRNRGEIDNDAEFEKLEVYDDETVKAQIQVNPIGQDSGIINEGKIQGNDASSENGGEEGESGLKRSSDRLLEEARLASVPKPGSGRVMHLVKAFEKFKLIPNSNDLKEKEGEEVKDENKGLKWELNGLQQPPKFSNTEIPFSLFSPSDLLLTSESLGLDSNRSYSLDSSQGSISISVRTSADGRTSRRRSAESSVTISRRHCKRKQLKPTSQKPFMLRTEQRGKCKEEEFTKKLQQMMEEEKKLRIPIAQGLPWTTDEPECLVKPPAKENTRPVNLVLHSDIRAEERAEFDHQVAKKMSVIEEYRMERERQQKLAEEEEIRRLRKEIVPKAQPMPYFDRPFIPRRSTKQPTIPREPKFHVPQQKKIKCCLSWDDNCSEYEG
ncbi:microtubule-destabilizing protein 60-like [Primulina eburnea]|uniref:microtubule-destabilizing protein 60-like n=1 Tax=Primulina eburnea TaxID=1245227 RepID=UPI003C6BDE47